MTFKLTCFFSDSNKYRISIQQQPRHGNSFKHPMEEPEDVEERHHKVDPTVAAVLRLLGGMTLTFGWPCLILSSGEWVVGKEPHVVLMDSSFWSVEAAFEVILTGVPRVEYLGEAGSLGERNCDVICLKEVNKNFKCCCAFQFNIFTL